MNIGHRGRINDALGSWSVWGRKIKREVPTCILVDPKVLLRVSFKPKNVSCGSTHDHIEMTNTFRGLIRVVAKDMSLSK